jgi:hypothetical protein
VVIKKIIGVIQLFEGCQLCGALQERLRIGGEPVSYVELYKRG